MLTSQRKHHILAQLAAHGQVLAKELSVALQATEDTIRRDLRELAAHGLLQRVHGGALSASPAAGNTLARASIASQDKADLGKLGASLVKAGQVVLLDGGTTALQIAKHLPLSLQATVVTHSPEVACALAAHSKLDVIMLGGKLFRHSMVNMGAQTLQAAAQMHIDVYFMGVTGAHLQAGLTTGDYEEAALKRALHAQAAETVVLASPEKLGTASPYVIAPLRAISILGLNHAPDAAWQSAAAQLGISVLLTGFV